MLEGGGYQCLKGLALKDGGANIIGGGGPNIRGMGVPIFWSLGGTTQNILVRWQMKNPFTLWYFTIILTSVK